MSGKEKKKKFLLDTLGIGSILREIRNKQSLTLDEVSQATGIADETIRRIETDKFEPKLSTLETLSDFYRVDLIELIARKRKSNNIFSELLVSRFNDILNRQDYNELRQFADSMINKTFDSTHDHENNFRTFFYAIKYFKYDPKNGQKDTIGMFEEVLLKLSPRFYDDKTPNYPYPFETCVILLLSITYRQNGDYTKAINLLNSLINRILSLPYINERFTNFLASAYINLAYTYHSKGEHIKVIETVDKCFENSKVNFTRTATSHLLFRKGLSMLIQHIEYAECVIYTSLTLMDDKTRDMIEKHLLDNYGVEFKK